MYNFVRTKDKCMKMQIICSETIIPKYFNAFSLSFKSEIYAIVAGIQLLWPFIKRRSNE
jgi:hypothetical protein